MTRNEAAERLREWLYLRRRDPGVTAPRQWLEEALATERRLTVERLVEVVTNIGEDMPWLLHRSEGTPNEGKVLAHEIATRLDDLATADVDEEEGKPLCPWCNGSGKPTHPSDIGHDEACARCEGAGTLNPTQLDENGRLGVYP